ncbi:WD40 repeat domain-containing protein [Hymenobacter cellulosivorans]|uniref:WD40 repeat domain-containing protein n=1 Tax=Hymenobacter cellulosivorans TaxID=2932249 RepID=A0ABY4F9R2_9BACT|nr:hypothetical protein [Hymenobacter cellulosivorans]UOQ53406.1 hypothetical protein MUN80_01295 [Hymenobacter cellulosivorans]
MMHHLWNQQTNTTCTLTVADTRVVMETGKPGRSRRTEKQFATAPEAAAYAERQEWTRLKQGFVGHNPAAAPGQPLLHSYIGGGYTGSLALADTPAGRFVYQHGWFRAPADQQDFLVHLDDAGQQQATIPLPVILAWDMHYQPAWHALVLNLDHSIVTYDLARKQFEPLSARGRSPSSFVATAAGRTAYAANQELVVLEADRRPLFRLPFTTQLDRGSVLFAAALAHSGELLALHTEPGKIQVRSATDGALRHTFTGDFGRVRQLAFAANDQLLLLLEAHSKALRCFDLQGGREVESPLHGGEEWPSILACCLNADQSYLALLRGTWVELYDATTWQCRQRFRLAHCVKSAKLRFMRGGLGVRTDYGCFSLYRV